jgi:hypothetical protein
MRAVTHIKSLFITFPAILILASLSPAAAAPADANLSYRLKTALQHLILQKRDIERDLDETASQITRLEHARDYGSVVRALAELQKTKRDQERQQQDLLLEIKDLENDLRLCN